MNRLIFCLIFLNLIAGCTHKFSCKNISSNGCQSVKEVYEKTSQGYVDYRQSVWVKDKSLSALVVKENPDYVKGGDPILTKPSVLRVLINAYEDEDGDLNAGGFIYMKTKDSEWIKTP